MKTYLLILAALLLSQTACSTWKKLSNRTKGSLSTLGAGLVSGAIGSATASDQASKDKEAITIIWALGGALLFDQLVVPEIYPANAESVELTQQIEALKKDNQMLKDQIGQPQMIISEKKIVYDDNGTKRPGKMIRKKVDIIVPSSIPNVYYRQTEQLKFVPDKGKK